MKKFIILLHILVFWGISYEVLADRITNALKQLEKKKYEDARSLADKELKKDSTNAGAKFIYALYFMDKDNPRFFVDSAYIAIQEALLFLPKTPEKSLKEWQKIGIDAKKMQGIKAEIETIAFEKTLQTNNIVGWQFFIEFYAQAPQIEEATKVLHSLVWQETKQKNTIASYENFIQQYPLAVQIKEAITQKDRLIFERETTEKNFQAYQRFITKYPKNQFVSEAANELFFYHTAEQTPKAYQDFIQKFPQATATQRAWAWLKTLVSKEKGLDFFIEKFPQNPLLAKLQELLPLQKMQYVPVYQNQKYGYLNELGEQMITYSYENIPHEYFCESANQDLIIINQQEQLGLINKLGEVVIQPQFDQIEKFDTDLWKVIKNAKQGLYHSAGFEILPLQYDGIELLNAQLIKVKRNKRWGLMTYNGKMVADCKFTDISLKGRFVIFTRGELLSALTTEKLLTEILQNRMEIVPRYEKSELIDENFIKLGLDERFGLLNAQDEWVLPLNFTQIQGNSQTGWACERDSTWRLYHRTGKILKDSIYQKIMVGNEYIALKKGKSWALLNNEGKYIKPYQYDSLAFVGSALLMVKNKKLSVEFLQQKNSKIIDLTGCKNIRMEKNMNFQGEELLYAEKNDKVSLYQKTGKLITSNLFSSAYMLDNLLINVSSQGKFGIIDTTGKVIVAPKYDGISNAEIGFQHLLVNNKFGLFHHKRNIKIEPFANTQLKLYAKHDSVKLFIALKNDKQGLIDRQGKEKIAFKYNQINYWQEKIALVQLPTETWQLIDFEEKKVTETPKEKPNPKEKDKNKNKNKPNEDSTKIVFEQIEFLQQNDNQVLIKYQQKKLWGLWSNTRGKITEPIYTHIRNVGIKDKPLLVAEIRNKTKKIEIFEYINHEGKVIWSKQLSPAERQKLICEEPTDD